MYSLVTTWISGLCRAGGRKTPRVEQGVTPWIRVCTGHMDIFLAIFPSFAPAVLYLVKQLPPEAELQLIPVAKHLVRCERCSLPAAAAAYSSQRVQSWSLGICVGSSAGTPSLLAVLM